MHQVRAIPLLLVPFVLGLVAQDAPAPRPSKGKGGKPGTFPDETIKVGEETRAFKLVVPPDLDATKPVPLLFVFHGMGDSKDFICRYSGFEELAPKEGFIAVFPEGKDKRWALRPGEENIDIKFFDSLFAHVTSHYNVDFNRVYLTGMSMGAYFSNCLASQRSDKVAAIAPHSGGLGALAFTGVKAKRKYAVLVVHGDEDRIVKVEEGRKSREVYAREGHAVEYLEIKGLGHAWAVKEDITAKMWKFFMAHPIR